MTREDEDMSGSEGPGLTLVSTGWEDVECTRCGDSIVEGDWFALASTSVHHSRAPSLDCMEDYASPTLCLECHFKLLEWFQGSEVQ